jgi:thioredoxin-dependent peroxiredoxin
MTKARPAALKEGDAAPNIRLQTDTGSSFQLSDLKGKNVVLYFYPRANTPGCTVEACEFRDASRSLSGRDTVVVGVSPDAVGPQSKFKVKFDLPFTLLCDVDRKAAEAFGVWKEKSMYGRKVMGIERTTFLIDKQGKIRRIFSKVKAKGHAAEVIEALSAL